METSESDDEVRGIRYALPIVVVEGPEDELEGNTLVKSLLKDIQKEELADFPTAVLKLYGEKNPPESARCTHILREGTCNTGTCYIVQKDGYKCSEIWSEKDSSGNDGWYVKACRPWRKPRKGDSLTFRKDGWKYKIYCIEGCGDS